MTSVGEILRTERENQGRTLAEIAEELCIMQRYLRAIEKDDLESLPGAFFYKSFARQYAAVLGVDEKLLQPGVDALTAPLDPVPGTVPAYNVTTASFFREERPPVRELDPIVEDGNRRHFPDHRIGLSLAGLMAVLLVCSGFYAWWNKTPRSGKPVIARHVAVPLATQVKSTDPAPAEGPSVAVTTTTGPDGLNRVVLTLSATEKTWLSITSEGKQIFSGILEPSQTKTVTGLEVAKMKVGNAGGLEVQWNGKPIGPIGPRGQVRVVLFTPGNFQILSPSQTL